MYRLSDLGFFIVLLASYFTPYLSLKTNVEIVGGNETTIQTFPYQVSIQNLGIHHCGGSIIGEDTILTAGHCINGLFASSYTVVAGATDLNNVTVRVKSKEHIVHEKYSNYDYDIGIIKLAEKLNFSDSIQPIELPEENEELPVGTAFNVSGYGVIHPGSIFNSNILRYVEVYLIEHAICEKAYLLFKDVTLRMLCAMIDGGGKDACQGDSGGPLVDGRTQVGIVSWGIGCASSTYPGVYTNVSSLRSWIKDKTGI